MKSTTTRSSIREASCGVQTLDLHANNVFQARIRINAALRRAGGAVYRLRIIHGHTMGTAIKDLVQQEYAADPRVLRIVAINEGVTDLILKELLPHGEQGTEG